MRRLQEELEQQRATDSGICMQEQLITLREQLQEKQLQETTRQQDTYFQAKVAMQSSLDQLGSGSDTFQGEVS
ncbi:hypothetical protein AAFF_G00190570 [Aldrovandia affinis]|uniref:Uncharacterized protein n=1 Tax=Aldrovandia affinis TaxID=143900 RepID=A0AAD7RM62_9TELE|nr:hypothetical protein AAFF_G00190570 [Aldrovandia affinis]